MLGKQRTQLFAYLLILLFYSSDGFAGNEPSRDLRYATGTVILIVYLLEDQGYRLAAKLFLGIGHGG